MADRAEDECIDAWHCHQETFSVIKSAQDRLTRCNSRSREGRISAAIAGVTVAEAALLDERRFLLGRGLAGREESAIHDLLDEAYRRLEALG